MPASPEPPRVTGGADAPTSGVIHDIGYRHYDGPRLGRGYIWRCLFSETARGAYGLGRAGRTKIMPMLLLAAMCLPALVVSVVASVTDADELAIGYFEYALQLQVLVAVYVAAQAPVTVSRDLRFGVMPLYFSRPMHRLDYAQAKYAAFATAVFVLLAAPLTILFAGALLAEMSLGSQLPGYLRSLAAAALLSVVLAGIGLVIAAFTPRRGLGVAAIISVLLVLAGIQAILRSIAMQERAETFAGYSSLLSPFTLVDGVARRFLGAESALDEGPPGTTGALVFLLVTVLLVAACYALLVLRYRKVAVS